MSKTFLLFLALGLGPSLVSADVANLKHPKKGPVGVAGWVVFWDHGNDSLKSFERHADQVDRVYCEWYHLQKNGQPQILDSLTPALKARVLKAAQDNHVELWAMVSNYDPAGQNHNPGLVHSFLRNPLLRAKHIQALIAASVKDGVQGIQIDYQNLSADDKDALSDFMRELSKACRIHGLMCGTTLPPKTESRGTWDDPASRDYRALGQAADWLVPMTYNLHWAASNPGCVTSPDFSEQVAHYTVSTMDAEKVELGYPVFGYDWVQKEGETISAQEFMNRARTHHVMPSRDWDDSQELFFNYTDAKGKTHQAWMPDSRSLEYQCDLVKKYHLYGITIWRFGMEPDDFWTTLKKVNSTNQLTAVLLPPGPSPVKPSPLPALKLFTDERDCEYVGAYPSDETKSIVLLKNKKRWNDIKLKGTAWSGAYIGVDQNNLGPYLEKGALQFYIRGNKGGETLSGVGFTMATDLNNKYHYETFVPLGNYCAVTTKWQLVTIPLSEFPLTGQHYEEDVYAHWLQKVLDRPISNGTDQVFQGRFQWNKVIEFVLDHSPNDDPNLEIEISNVVILPEYKAKVVLREKEAIQ